MRRVRGARALLPALALGGLIAAGLAQPACRRGEEGEPAGATARRRPPGGGYYLYNGCEVHDASFRLVHTFPGTLCRFLPGGELLAFISGAGPTLYSPDYRVLWTAPYKIVHHHMEVEVTGDTYILTETRNRYMGALLRFDALVKISRQGEVLTRWSTYERLEQLKKILPYPHPAEDAATGTWQPPKQRTYGAKEYFHINYVNVLPPTRHEGTSRALAPGNLLLSDAHFQMIFILAPDSYEVLWVHSLPRETYRNGQHCAQMLDNGNILMLINSRVGPKGLSSSVVELDPVTRQTVWRYEASPPEAMSNTRLGCATRLANGDTLITLGYAERQGDQPRVLRVTQAGGVVADHRLTRESSFYITQQEFNQPLFNVSWEPARVVEPYLPIPSP